MSPELLDPDQFGSKIGRPTEESDCYALGMTIFEVLSGQVPFQDYSYFAVMRKVLEGERPGRPEGGEGVWFTDDLWEMLGLCWSHQPGDRPTIEDVLECLEQGFTTWQPLPPDLGNGIEAGANDNTVTFCVFSYFILNITLTINHPL